MTLEGKDYLAGEFLPMVSSFGDDPDVLAVATHTQFVPMSGVYGSREPA